MADDSKVRASLVVRLLADDKVIAETEDAELWQWALKAMTKGIVPPVPAGGARSEEEKGPLQDSAGHVARFARQIEVEEAVLIGALGPTRDSPYLYIDARHWEGFKKSTPSKGRGAVTPARLAATAAVLWFKVAELGPVTDDHVREILEAAHLRELHPGRAIDSTPWLQKRAGALTVNPAKISGANDFVRAFCLEKKPEWKP